MNNGRTIQKYASAKRHVIGKTYVSAAYFAKVALASRS
jgi:hypothetical protein